MDSSLAQQEHSSPLSKSTNTTWSSFQSPSLSGLKKSFPYRPEKFLAFILRHKALELGLDIDKKGFVKLSELISLSEASMFNFTVEYITHLVNNDKKSRYELEYRPEVYIRAVQGHSIHQVTDDECWVKIKNIFNYPTIVHGTFFKPWSHIKTAGLNRMSRNDIHFAIGYPNDSHVKSGMQCNSEVYIELNGVLAYYNDINIYISKNNVILSPGINGTIPTKYFKIVKDCLGNVLLTTKYECIIYWDMLNNILYIIFNGNIICEVNNISLSNIKILNNISNELINTRNIGSVPYVVVINREYEEEYKEEIIKAIDENTWLHSLFYIDYICMEVGEDINNVKKSVFDSSMIGKVQVNYEHYYERWSKINEDESSSNIRDFGETEYHLKDCVLKMKFNDNFHCFKQ